MAGNISVAALNAAKTTLQDSFLAPLIENGEKTIELYSMLDKGELLTGTTADNEELAEIFKEQNERIAKKNEFLKGILDKFSTDIQSSSETAEREENKITNTLYGN